MQCRKTVVVSGQNCLYQPLVNMKHFFYFIILYNEGDDNSSSIRPCNISNNPDNEDRICYEETIEKFDKRERVCPCGVACKERNFQSTISSSTWPSNQVMKIFINLH